MSADARLWPLDDNGVCWGGVNDWESERREFFSLAEAIAHTEQVAGGTLRWIVAENNQGHELKGYL